MYEDLTMSIPRREMVYALIKKHYFIQTFTCNIVKKLKIIINYSELI